MAISTRAAVNFDIITSLVGQRSVMRGINSILVGMGKAQRANSQLAAPFQRNATMAAQFASSLRSAAGAAAQLGVVALTARQLQYTFRELVRLGVEWNKVLETGALGIASVAIATRTYVDAQGKQLTMTEALGAAQNDATRQLRALRVAGLQTAATTRQLIGAYQEAVGVGSAYGLTLQQIRLATVATTKAAITLGLPLFQINQEIRALLSGDIDRNARVAKALGITPGDVANAQKRNELFSFLMNKLEAFNVAGQAAQNTFAIIVSNLQEAVETFTGVAADKMFVQIRNALKAATSEFFDLQTAQVSKDLRGFLNIVRLAFTELGRIFSTIISGITGALRSISTTIDVDTSSWRAAIVVAADFASSVLELAGALLRLGGAAVEAGVRSGGIGAIFRSLADGFRQLTTVLNKITVSPGLVKLITQLVALRLSLGLYRRVLGTLLGPMKLFGAAAVTSAAKVTALSTRMRAFAIFGPAALAAMGPKVKALSGLWGRLLAVFLPTAGVLRGMTGAMGKAATGVVALGAAFRALVPWISAALTLWAIWEVVQAKSEVTVQRMVEQEKEYLQSLTDRREAMGTLINSYTDYVELLKDEQIVGTERRNAEMQMLQTRRQLITNAKQYGKAGEEIIRILNNEKSSVEELSAAWIKAMELEAAALQARVVAYQRNAEKAVDAWEPMFAQRDALMQLIADVESGKKSLEDTGEAWGRIETWTPGGGKRVTVLRTEAKTLADLKKELIDINNTIETGFNNSALIQGLRAVAQEYTNVTEEVKAMKRVQSIPPKRPSAVDPAAEADRFREAYEAALQVEREIKTESDESLEKLRTEFDNRAITFAQALTRVIPIMQERAGKIKAVWAAIERDFADYLAKEAAQRQRVQNQSRQADNEADKDFEIWKGQVIDRSRDAVRVLLEAQADIINARGTFAERLNAVPVAVELELGERIATLSQFTDLFPDIQKTIDSMVALAKAEKQTGIISKELGGLADVTRAKLDEIKNRQEIGLISELDARQASARAYAEEAEAIKPLLEALEQLAKTDPSEAVNNGLREATIRFNEVSRLAKQMSSDWLNIRQAAREGLQDGIVTVLTQIGLQIQTIEQALKALVNSILKPIQQAIAENLAQMATSAVFKLFGGDKAEAQKQAAAATTKAGIVLGLGATQTQNAATSLFTASTQFLAAALAAAAAAKAIKNANGGGGDDLSGLLFNAIPLPFASGGYVSGPGTATSDSIAARLSRGEYVVNARAVRSLGVGFLDLLNATATPNVRRRRGGYALGGLVGPVGNADGAGAGGDIGVMLGLEDGLVAKEIISRPGQRAVVSAIRANRKAIREMIRV